MSYEELGHQIVNIDAVLQCYDEHNLTHTDSFEKLEQRRLRYSQIRGELKTDIE